MPPRVLPSLGLELPVAETPSYRVDNSGAFHQGELSISEDGMKMSNNSNINDMNKNLLSSSSPTTSLNSKDSSPSSLSLQWSDLIIGSSLGSGQSSTVYSSVHRLTGHQYAIKQISIGDKSKRHQILKELTTLHSHSQCPYIIQLYAAFFNADSGIINIVLELMNSGDLSQLLQSVPQHRLSEAHLAYFARQLITALCYLRKHHLVHRDIKPSNICLNSASECKLSDFGITSQLDTSVENCSTFVGTCNYMSPERVMGQKYSYSSDIWSIGIVILECAKGEFPYPQSQFYLDMMNNIVSGPAPKVPSSLGFSTEFKSFIDACLIKDPDKRATAEDLFDHDWLKLEISNSVNKEQMIEWIKSVTKPLPTHSLPTSAEDDINKAFGD